MKYYKLVHFLIFFILFTSKSIVVYGDEAVSSIDDKSSVYTGSKSLTATPAIPADPSNPADSHASYLYDLKKLIEKSRENIKQVNQKIKEQSILKRNQKREERARLYYEKGMQLTNEGKLDEAREYFEKAVRITEHPEMSGYIRESQRRLKKQEAALHHQENERYHQIKKDAQTRKEDVEAAYKEAVDLYKQQKYHPAKEAFQHVDEIAPEYRATSSYLKIIDQDIVKADALAAKEQAKEIQRQQQEAEAARSREKEIWRKQIEEKEKERKAEINRQAQEVYEQALNLYKTKHFAEAKKKFEEVSWVLPDYKATIRYLRRIDHDAELEKERVAKEQERLLAQQRWEEEIALKKKEALRQREIEAKERQHKIDLEEQFQFIYKGAVKLFDDKHMDEALEKFQDIEKLNPGFRSTRGYIARIEQWKIDLQKQAEAVLEHEEHRKLMLLHEQKEEQLKQKMERLRQQEFDEQEKRHIEQKRKMDELLRNYEQALSLYRSHQWAESKSLFQVIEKSSPDFKKTRNYLQKIDEIIEKEEIALKAALLPVKNPQISILKQKVEKLRQEQFLQKEKARMEEKRKRDQLDFSYTEAISLYRNQQWNEAKTSFESIEKNNPDYKRTRRYLQKIDEILEKKEIATKAALLAVQHPKIDVLKQKIVKPRQEELPQEEKTRIEEKRKRDQLDSAYQEAINLYHHQQWVSAKTAFETLDNNNPDYKKTRRYLSKIKKILEKDKISENTTQKDLSLSTPLTKEKSIVIPLPQPVLPTQDQAQSSESRQVALEKKHAMEIKIAHNLAEDLYRQGINFYREHQWQAAKEKFMSLEAKVPDYKRTQRYLDKITKHLSEAPLNDHQLKLDKIEAPHVLPVKSQIIPQISNQEVVTKNILLPKVVDGQKIPEVAPLKENKKVIYPDKTVTIEDQQKQTQEITALVEKSARLYQRITDMANDHLTYPVKRKMARLDAVLNELRQSKEHLLRQMRREQLRRQQEESEAKQQARRNLTEKLYQEARQYYQDHEYLKAKGKFLQVESNIPDYKSLRSYLNRIDEQQKKENSKMLVNEKNKQAENIRLIQQKENQAISKRNQDEQIRQRQKEQDQEIALEKLAQRAVSINDEIIKLAGQQDLTAMMDKFSELENTVMALSALKDQLKNQKERKLRDQDILNDAKHRYAPANILPNNLDQHQPVLSVDKIKHKAVLQEQNSLFKEAVDRFERKKFSQAKLLFGELAQMHDRRAEVWLKKIDRAITRQLLSSQAAEERERTAFIAEQLKAQRELSIIQETERKRQKKLTESLENQKKLYEDNRLSQLRKEEIVKSQERERQLQEQKRLALEKVNKNEVQIFSFHKIKLPSKNDVEIKPKIVEKPVLNLTPVSLADKKEIKKDVKLPVQPNLTPAQVKEKVEYSNRRKAFFDKKFKVEKNRLDRLARIKSKKEEREARIKARQEARALKAKLLAEKILEERRKREEYFKDQEHRRELRRKEQEIAREEAKRRAAVEEQEHKRQIQLQIQRQQIKKQLEDGVEAMYAQAVSLYKQGDYLSASEKFKDVDDILPGYKDVNQYLNDSREKSMTQKSPVILPEQKLDLAPAASAVPVVSKPHEDNVSKALDFFDPNGK